MVQTLWDLLDVLDVEAVGVEGIKARFTVKQMREILRKWNRPLPVGSRRQGGLTKSVLAKAVYDHALQRRVPFELHEFAADWCQPCKSVARAFEKRKADLGGGDNALAKDLGVDKVVFHNVTLTKTADSKLANEWSIVNIPAFVLTHGGKRADVGCGAIPINELRQLIASAKELI